MFLLKLKFFQNFSNEWKVQKINIYIKDLVTLYISLLYILISVMYPC